MSPPVYAWICTAGGVAIVVALDHRWRTFDVRSHGTRLAGSVLLGVLTGCLVLAVAGPDAGGAFLTHWATAYVSVLDTAVVLALVAALVGSPSRVVLLAAVGLGAILRAGLPAVTVSPGTGWVTVPAGVALLGLGGWLFFGAEHGMPAGGLIRAGWGLAVGCGAVALFAWTSVPATSDGSGYLGLLANMAAVVALRPLFLLLHGTFGRGEWSRTGMAVLAAFTGAKLLGSALLPGEVLASTGLVVLTAVVVTTVLGAIALPSLGSAPRAPTRFPAESGPD